MLVGRDVVQIKLIVYKISSIMALVVYFNLQNALVERSYSFGMVGFIYLCVYLSFSFLCVFE